MEYLSRSLLLAETDKSIIGVKFSRKAPPITHLLFADDILIFGQANFQHVNNFLKILPDFGKLSGQMLNFDKSCVYFSKKLSPEFCDSLAQDVNMNIVSDSEKYLGAPLLLGHSKIKSFDHIVQSFEARLGNYVSTTLNQASRSTLIKSVLNSLPSYQMGCFKIPTTLIDKLESLQMNFWWSHRAKKGIKFIAWDNINKSKDLGGLGFRNLETFNVALISFFIYKNLMKIVPGYGEEFTGVLKMLGTIVVGTLDVVLKPKSGTRTWNVHLIHYLFDLDTATKIIAMHVHVIGEDSLIWLPDRKGQFSVKSVYMFYVDPLIPLQCLKDIVSIRDKLSRYKEEIDLKCSLCNHPAESINRIFLDWPYVRSVWLALNINVGNVMAQYGSFKNWILSWFSAGSNFTFGTWITRHDFNKLLMVSLWTIWKDRRSKIFQNISPNKSMSIVVINRMVSPISNPRNTNNGVLQVQNWKPPENGSVKFNFDASFKHDTLHGGIGLIVRNCAGYCLGVQGQFFNGGMREGVEVEELECKAMKAAATLAVAKDFNNVIFESDCEALIKFINE
ncbi:uncharacterized protein LOC113279856 [Papaver somniferum]|uniref:uncharacterized protein LOC113279856 n=1 Tax=Papaver somniferum TaxID=3469 RepID=UPI000E703251|nr:uncharacterized protein LOC113279856 [Papaver somniferum]